MQNNPLACRVMTPGGRVRSTCADFECHKCLFVGSVTDVDQKLYAHISLVLRFTLVLQP